MKQRAMIRFIRDIEDDDGSYVWRRTYFYRIILETSTEYYLETEKENEYCALAKQDMEQVAILYICDCQPMVFCKHCRYARCQAENISCDLVNAPLWEVID